MFLKILGDIVFVDIFSYKCLHTKYKKGDIVICICPYDSGKTVCKRIIALPGERVTFRNESLGPEIIEKVIPPGHVWLEGDNKENSTDSRKYGKVPQGLLLGRVCFQFYPPRWL